MPISWSNTNQKKNPEKFPFKQVFQPALAIRTIENARH